MNTKSLLQMQLHFSNKSHRVFRWSYFESDSEDTMSLHSRQIWGYHSQTEKFRYYGFLWSNGSRRNRPESGDHKLLMEFSDSLGMLVFTESPSYPGHNFYGLKRFWTQLKYIRKGFRIPDCQWGLICWPKKTTKLISDSPVVESVDGISEMNPKQNKIQTYFEKNILREKQNTRCDFVIHFVGFHD